MRGYLLNLNSPSVCMYAIVITMCLSIIAGAMSMSLGDGMATLMSGVICVGCIFPLYTTYKELRN